MDGRAQTMKSLQELQRNWEGLAQADPLWAICTDPRKRHGHWTPEEFFGSGKKEVEAVLAYAAEIGLSIDGTSPSLDFGCGVGRLTRALAEYFPEACGMEMHCIRERVIRKLIEENGAHVIDVRLTNSCEPSFSGNLQYLAQEP